MVTGESEDRDCDKVISHSWCIESTIYF